MDESLYRILPGTNPFAVHSPEDMPADEVVELFVQSMAELTNMTAPGHMLMHGPRGTGKSMIFRFLKPDCQMIHHQSGFLGLPFLGIYIGVKRSDLGVTELRRLSGDAPDYYFLEHLMVMHVFQRLCEVLQTYHSTDNEGSMRNAPAQELYERTSRRLKRSGYSAEDLDSNVTLVSDFLTWILDVTETLRDEANIFIKRMRDQASVIYEGPLCGYADFVLPFIDDLHDAGLIPSGPVFLLIDDADVLSAAQTQVLNSWIYMRTSMRVSIKATTQYRYKTFRTPAGSSIEVPHDYHELDTSQLYTRKSGRYHNLISEILEKRFRHAKVGVSPAEFFPPNPEQEFKVESIRREYIENWSSSGRGARPQDDADRYARPDYIRDTLKGPSSIGVGSVKKGSTYSYSGFDQLINISDGVYRFFLDPAFEMYQAQAERNGGRAVQFIDHDIQNEKIRDEANKLRFSSFDKLTVDEQHEIGGTEKVRRLQNLVKTLGEVFHLVLISDRSERRVFSIALSQQPDSLVLETLAYGVASGYFSESTIGNKNGTGRTRLYVLTRRLGPAFLLDPNGFAGYLFVTNTFLREAMENPSSAIATFEKRLGKKSNDSQAALFDEEDSW